MQRQPRGWESVFDPIKDALPRTCCRSQFAGIVLLVLLAGCSPQARLVTETATGGIVTYTFLHEQDILSSPGRYDALQLLADKCPRGYRVIREGEIARINQALDKAWNGQIPPEKIWKIQFECK